MRVKKMGIGNFLILTITALVLLFSTFPTEVVQAQSGPTQSEPISVFQIGECQLQNPVINAGYTRGLHSEAAVGWWGVDVSTSDGVVSLFADGGTVVFAGWDGKDPDGTRNNNGGGNGVIIRGTGACSHMAFAAWHDDNDTSWIANNPNVDPNQILITIGQSGSATGPHHHITVLSTEEGLCGITNYKFQPGTSVLGDAYAYDYRDVISKCGTSAPAPAVTARADYHYANYGADGKYNALYWWYMTSSGQTPVQSLGHFSGSFVFEKKTSYYANAMGGGNYTTGNGYKCVGNCNGPNQGMGVCDAISTMAKFVTENTNGCITVHDYQKHGPPAGGTTNYVVPEAGSEWSLVVQTSNSTPLTQDPTKNIGSTADVRFYNNCDEAITLKISGDLNGVVVEALNGNHYSSTSAVNTSNVSYNDLPVWEIDSTMVDVSTLLGTTQSTTDEVQQRESQPETIDDGEETVNKTNISFNKTHVSIPLGTEVLKISWIAIIIALVILYFLF